MDTGRDQNSLECVHRRGNLLMEFFFWGEVWWC